MSKDVKNVIVLKNIYSNNFEEVIFVLKKGTSATNPKKGDLVSEARKIVKDYVNRKEEYNPQQMYHDVRQEINGFERGNNLNKVLNICLVISVILFASLLIKII